MVENQSTPIHAWVVLSVALFAVSSAGAVFEMIEDIAPVTKAAWRLQATALVLFPPFIWQYSKADSKLRSKWSSNIGLLTLSGFFLCLHFGSWLISLDHTTLTHSLLFVTAHPLVILVGMWLLRRPATSRQTVGAVTGFIGASVVILGGGGEAGVTIYGDTLAFIGAVTVVGYLVIGRMVRGWMPLFLYAFPVTLVAAITLTIWATMSEGASFNFDSMNGAFGWTSAAWMAYIGYLALGPGLAGHTGINAVLRWIPPLIISMFLVMEPVVGSIIGWLLGVDVIPSTWTILGGILMISGLALVTFESDSSEYSS
ncbi:MAG TPA: DMT family transporter [Candidatus Thalassarchaeaceae archaeon]|jgi:drug/metabolite transporter (DMT)-like permease|nr:DMT family transporter [Candidatus Thalassarchaeaceae archaeon]|tara:strand:+ start:37 stop:975 length:939 start_codon:yes stop_codon:yes gene_type:complete